MKELDLRKVTDEVERMCIEGNYFIGKEVLDKIKEAYAKEKSEVGKRRELSIYKATPSQIIKKKNIERNLGLFCINLFIW